MALAFPIELGSLFFGKAWTRLLAPDSHTKTVELAATSLIRYNIGDDMIQYNPLPQINMLPERTLDKPLLPCSAELQCRVVVPNCGVEIASVYRWYKFRA